MRRSTTIIIVAVVLFGAAGCNSGTRRVGDPDGGTGVPPTDRVCLGPDRTPSASCAVESSGEICDLASNNECGALRVEEVWDSPDGPCLRLEINNVCDQVIYSVTCIEETPGDYGQCWWSTTIPGATIDVGHCPANGRFVTFHTLSSGELDVIYDACTM